MRREALETQALLLLVNDDGNIAMTKIEQVLGRELTSSIKVDADLRNGWRHLVLLPIAENQRHLLLKVARHIGNIHARPHNNVTIHPAAHHQFHLRATKLKVILGITEEGLIVMFAGAMLDGLDNFWIERVGNGWENESNSESFPVREATRQNIWTIPQL